MILPNVREIKDDAAYALRRAREPKKVILAFAGITILIAALLTVANNFLSTQIEGTGGLSNFGIRSILSTAQSVLPIAQTVILLCLEFGYLHAILRMARGQYADHTDLKVGFRRFGPILRLNIIQGLRFFSLGFALFYLSIQIFLLTPWSEPLIDLLLPLVESAGTSADVMALMDAATLNQATRAMMPMFVIFAVLYAVFAIPMFYRMRLAVYILLDDPNGRATLALRKSAQMLRGNKLRLFKLDFSFWWYYLLIALVTAISYGDMIFAMLGIPLPFNDTIAFYLFYFLYLAMLFAIYYFLRNPMEIAYAKAYDSLVEKPKDDGVVLGNIFDL